VLEYRFEGSAELAGHALGNLLITALTHITSDFAEACGEAGRILSIRGRVLPATLTNVTLVAKHVDGSRTVGQRSISESEHRIESVALEPPPERSSPDILSAIEQAEMIIIGPGSLYTSVLPNLLIPDIVATIRKARAIKVYVCNVTSSEGETRGFSLRDHIEALQAHVGRGLVDYVLVNSGTFLPATVRRLEEKGIRPVRWNPSEFPDGTLDFQIVEADVVNRSNEVWHDSRKLSRALLDLLNRERNV
jgi:uncharacterized cofD-like protein